MRWASVARAGTSAPLRRRSGSGAGPRRSSPGPPRLACRRPRSCARCSPGLVDPLDQVPADSLGADRAPHPGRPAPERVARVVAGAVVDRGLGLDPLACPVDRHGAPSRHAGALARPKVAAPPLPETLSTPGGPVRSSSSMSTDTRRGAVAAARWARASIRSLEPAIDTPPEPTSERRARSSPSGKASPQYRVASGPTKTSAPHSMSSGPKTPTWRHRLSGRRPRMSGIRSGGSRSVSVRPAASRTGRGAIRRA